MKHAPILVTGAPRSGTTFLGKMLALPRHVLYVDEPFNSQTGIEGVRTFFPHPLEWQEGGTEPYADVVRQLFSGEAQFKPSELRASTKNPLRQLARELWVSRENLNYKLQTHSPLKRRFLIKDPMACYLSEYLYRQFSMKTVVIMRHPLSTIASYKRLGWHYDVAGLLVRSGVAGAELGQALRSVELATMSDIEAWSLLWLHIYTALREFMKRNPSMIFITHEELSLRPQHILARLYDLLELPFTLRVSERITAHTNAENPIDPTDNQPHVLHRNSAENVNRWKKILTDDEMAKIRHITGPFVSQYYPESSWD
ncbi:MAG TPA: sulfotransferase [Candidatus Saccharimonadales bacterium]|nr:sulfotransferase [Candidatus Saccharimonadales bacterium]